MDKNRYWRTDLSSNLVDDLCHAASLSSIVLDDDRKWKWFILSIHCATQSACVCALRGCHSSQVSILSKRSQKHYWAIIHEPQSPPNNIELRLAPFLDLYERVTNPLIMPSPFTAPKSQHQTRDMTLLNTMLRNNFQHFSNDGMSIEISGLPRISKSACEIIEHLAVTRRTMNFRLTDEQHKAIIESLAAVRANMTAVERKFASSLNA